MGHKANFKVSCAADAFDTRTALGGLEEHVLNPHGSAQYNKPKSSLSCMENNQGMKKNMIIWQIAVDYSGKYTITFYLLNHLIVWASGVWLLWPSTARHEQGWRLS